MFWSSRKSAGVGRASLVLCAIVMLALIVGVGYVQWRRNDVSTHANEPESAVSSIGSMFDYKPTLLIVGDSFAGGTGDPTFRPYPYLLGDRLGWNLTLDAEGGTGFVNVAGGVKSGRVPFIDRLARDGQLYDVDYVLIDGGRNDLGLPPAEVIPAADEYINKTRAIWPKAKIIVVLPSYVSAVEASNYPAVSAGMRRSAEEVNAYVIDPVAEGWYRGKDLDPLFWTDGVHLNAAGNEYYASRIIDSMRAMGLAK
jgi:lysophospholipase L1-like esterase